MPFTISPVAATFEEVEEMEMVSKRAFGPDPLWEFCFNRPGVPRHSKEESIAKHIERMKSPHFFYHKAVDSEHPGSPIAGIAIWYWVEDPQISEENIPWGDPPLGVHTECHDACIGVLQRWRLNQFRELNQPFLYMALLTVVPEMQGRGVGYALLTEGLKAADHRSIPAFVKASPAGLGLYKKFGWEEKLRTIVNLKKFGGPDVECVSVGLIRPATATEIPRGLPSI